MTNHLPTSNMFLMWYRQIAANSCGKPAKWATDYGGAANDPLNDNAATRALRQSLSELSTAIGNKEWAHSAQQQQQVVQSTAQQQMWSIQQRIIMLHQQVANLAVNHPQLQHHKSINHLHPNTNHCNCQS